MTILHALSALALAPGQARALHARSGRGADVGAGLHVALGR